VDWIEVDQDLDICRAVVNTFSSFIKGRCARKVPKIAYLPPHVCPSVRLSVIVRLSVCRSA
jgi:hypothetical protein